MQTLPDPIIILGMARSGTSMTAGLFHLHGIWTGKCRTGAPINPKGFFEHRAIKKLLKDWFGSDLTFEKDGKDGFREEVEKILMKENYPGGPWLVKHSALYHRAWRDFNPKFIKVRRPIISTVKANIAAGLHNGLLNGRMEDVVKLHHEVMNRLPGVDVFTDEIVKRDYSSLERAFKYCDIEMDEEKVDDFVEPEYWHF